MKTMKAALAILSLAGNMSSLQRLQPVSQECQLELKRSSLRTSLPTAVTVTRSSRPFVTKLWPRLSRSWSSLTTVNRLNK